MAEDRTLFSVHVEERDGQFFIVKGDGAIGPYPTQGEALDAAFALVQSIAEKSIMEILK